MTRYILNVPHTYIKDGKEITKYTRVGSVFENTRQDGSGDKALSIKLNFPVGATELVAFTPKANDDDNQE